MGKFKNIKYSIFGKSGTGKSTFFDRMTINRDRYILLDKDDDRREILKSLNLQEVKTINELQHLLHENYSKGFRYWYKPTSGNDQVKELSDLSLLIYNFQEQVQSKYGTNLMKRLTFGVDELAFAYPNHKISKEENNFLEIVNTGRNKNVELIGASQRPASVNVDFSAQCDVRIFFRLDWKNDQEYLVKTYGSEFRDRILNLQELEYIRLENGLMSYGKLRF